VVTTIYLDALFLLSGGMDFFLLLICGKLTDVFTSKPRLLVGACFGALYSVSVVLFFDSVFSTLASKMIASLLITLISYGRGSAVRFFRLWCTYLVSNFTLIGCVLVIGWLRERNLLAMRFSSIVIAVVLFYTAVSLLLKRVARPRDRDASVVIEFCGKTCTLHALVDTGNLVRDPLSGAPVIVADLNALKCLFDSETFAMFECAKPENYPYLIETLEFAHRVRLIPYCTVGTNTALMLAFRPDSVTVNKKSMKNALVGFCTSRVSRCGEFDALVGVGEERI